MLDFQFEPEEFRPLRITYLAVLALGAALLGGWVCGVLVLAAAFDLKFKEVE